MYEERNGRPGRSYDERHENWRAAPKEFSALSKQNQSPVVTDEELIARAEATAKWLETNRMVSPLEASATLRKLADRLEALAKENFDLAANQCSAGYGDEYGNHCCRHEDAARALTQPSGKVSDEMVERAMKSWFGDDYQNGTVMGVAATLDIHGEMRSALEAAQLSARPVVTDGMVQRMKNAYIQATKSTMWPTDDQFLAILEDTLSALEGEDDNEKLERFDREIQSELVAPQPATPDLEAQAWDCDTWPEWLHTIVDRTNEVADRLDMSSEQAIAYGVLLSRTDAQEARAALSNKGSE